MFVSRSRAPLSKLQTGLSGGGGEGEAKRCRTSNKQIVVAQTMSETTNILMSLLNYLVGDEGEECCQVRAQLAKLENVSGWLLEVGN